MQQIPLMISKDWRRKWLHAELKHAFPWASVDYDLYSHIATMETKLYTMYYRRKCIH